MNRKDRAIVFDMDGVLFDTERVYFEAWDIVAAEMGIDVSEVRMLCAGHNAADSAKIFDEYFGGQATFAEFSPRKTDCFHRLLQENGVPEKPGLHELLEYLKTAGHKIALATSTKREGALYNLEQTNILQYFDVLVTGDMFEHGKPDPEIYLTACRLLGSEPSETYAVEDSYAGLESAHSAGMRVVMIPDLFPPTPRTKDISVEISSLDELLDIIRSVDEL